MTMTFKEALIAHLQGEKVEYQFGDQPWRSLAVGISGVLLEDAIKEGYGGKASYRITPPTILVNGVEVPAPQKDAPAYGDSYFSVQNDEEDYVCALAWTGDDYDWRLLERGLLYLDKESAIARAKAMLITQEVK